MLYVSQPSDATKNVAQLVNYKIKLKQSKIIFEEINTLQKRAIRVINKSKFDAHTDPLFKNCSILKVIDISVTIG